MSANEELVAAMMAEVEEATRQGRNPRFGVKDDEPEPPAPALIPDGSGLYCRKDMLAFADLKEYREHTMPNGKRLYVFPVTGRDIEVAAARLNKDSSLPYRQALTVALACYADTERRTPVFRADDADDIKAALPWQTIQEICRKSEEIATGDELLGEGVRGFFGRDLVPFFETLCSTCDTWADCPPGLKERATQLASLASVASLLGRWTAGEG